MTNIFVILIFLCLVPGCAPIEPLLIDNFEGSIDKTTVDSGASDGSSVAVSADKQNKVCADQSLRIEYDLKTSGYMWVARGYNLDVKGAAQWLIEPAKINWRSFNAFSLQVYGGKTGGVIAFDVKDSGGEVWRALIDDDFSGWKEVIVKFKDFFVRKDWQPQTADNNETMNFPLMSYQVEPRLPGQGKFNIDCVQLIQYKGK